MSCQEVCKEKKAAGFPEEHTTNLATEDGMKSVSRMALLRVFAPLSVSCSGKVTDPKKMIEIAAKPEHPRGRLTHLYSDSVLPEYNEDNAWNMAQIIVRKALKNNHTGYQADTADFPGPHRIDVLDDVGAIETATGKRMREYFIRGHFHVTNFHGVKTRLNLKIHLRTADNENWKAYRVQISDPSEPTFASRVFGHQENAWEGFRVLRAPDSLYAQLDAYIKKRKKQLW